MVDRSRRRGLFAAVVLAGFVVVGCAGDVALPADADEELIEGSEIFRAQCARCHGSTGRGGIGPTLQEIESRLDDAAQRTVVVEGRKAMPRFASRLSDREIDAVVRYTREVL